MVVTSGPSHPSRPHACSLPSEMTQRPVEALSPAAC